MSGGRSYSPARSRGQSAWLYPVTITPQCTGPSSSATGVAQLDEAPVDVLPAAEGIGVLAPVLEHRVAHDLVGPVAEALEQLPGQLVPRRRDGHGVDHLVGD